MINLILVCLLASQLAWCGATALNNSNQQSRAVTSKGVDQQKLKLQAQELSDAVVNGDHARVADLTYPKLIELMGGRTQYIAALAGMKKNMEGEQSRISSVTVGEPRDVVEIDHRYYAIVPTTTRIKVPEGTLVGDAFMIGASTDGGQNWTFISSGGNSMDKEKLRVIIGPAADQLRIPEVKRPVLHNEPER